MNEWDSFNEELDKFSEMLDDWNLMAVDYYKAFSNMRLSYGGTSLIPYSICSELIEEEYPCEKYYMQMLMDVYAYHNIGEDFLDLLQRLIDEGYCKEYQKRTHELIRKHIKDGYITAYRGEFAVEDKGNLNYTQSVSYSLDYEQAKFFATRFNMLPLTKSMVYTVKVPVEDVLAYIDREDEVVCLPICMGGKMEVIKQESFL